MTLDKKSPARSAGGARVAAALLMLVAGLARAQSEDVIASQAGRYTVLPADGSTGCSLRLQKDKAIGGRLAVPGPECATYIPALSDAMAWYLDSGVTVIDATRKVVIKFEEAEGSVLSSPSVAVPKYFLVQAMAGVTHVPRVADIVGAWRLSQSSVRCSVVFDPGPGKPADWRPLRPEPNCKIPGVLRKLTRWRIAATSVEIEAGEEIVAFEPTGENQLKSDSGGYGLTRPKR